jgi:hypothetical protein
MACRTRGAAVNSASFKPVPRTEIFQYGPLIGLDNYYSYCDVLESFISNTEKAAEKLVCSFCASYSVFNLTVSL